MNIWGFVAAIFSLSIIFLGLPNQIYKNYLRKSVQGLSLYYWVLATGAYIAWVIYGATSLDYFILSAHLPGMVLCSLIIYQFIKYGNQSPTKNGDV